MLIENKASNLIVMPEIRGVKNAPKRLLPGINEVDAEYWVKAREQTTIKRKLKTGILIEKTKNHKDSSKLKADIIKRESGIKVLKDNLAEKRKELRKERVDEKRVVIEKDIKNLLLDIRDLKEELDKVKVNLLDKESNFKELSHKEKEEMIKDTMDIETLRKWKDDDNYAECRNMIMDQIKKIKEAKINDKIGKPSGTI